MIELDVVAESLDKKHILIGECKWTTKEDAFRLVKSLQKKSVLLLFIKDGQKIHLALFLKNEQERKGDAMVFLPSDVL